ncbi:MAG: hypothetical protein JWM98_2424 [Thermoleophilia bacterium]|nr:hypothetical protein [Thermoleophilia bacterium]
MSTGLRAHAMWTLFGLASIASMWFAYTAPGAVAMFVLIGLAFLLWYGLGSRGSWMALIVIGLGMGGLMGWQAVSDSRCPKPGTKVFLKADKPPVGCDEFRAVAGTMAVFCLLLALGGVAAPFYARRPDDDAGDDLQPGTSTPTA